MFTDCHRFILTQVFRTSWGLYLCRNISRCNLLGFGAGKDRGGSGAGLSKQNKVDLSEGCRSFASQWTHNLSGPFSMSSRLGGAMFFGGGLLLERYSPGVPADNNHVERMIRPNVIFRKISFQNMSRKRANTHDVLMSLLQSLRLQGRTPVTDVNYYFSPH